MVMAKETPMANESEDMEPEHLKDLRSRAEALPGAKAEAELLRLENAGLRAGIDLSSRQGKGWAATYEGNWDDTDAMKADYAEFAGITSAPAAEAAPEPEPADYQTGMSQDLREAHSGPASLPGEQPDEDPVEAGYAALHEARKRGVPEEHARAEVLNRLIDAGAQGDPRVLWDGEARDAWLRESGQRL